MFDRITREVVAGLEFYGDKGWLEKPKGFFARPPALSDVSVRKVKGHRRSFHRIFFDSGYTPHPARTGRANGGSGTPRTTASMHCCCATLNRDPGWLRIHGTEMGRAPLDLALFRAWKLHDELGLNVVMLVLPMHGPRPRGLLKGAVFPGQDVLDDVHATAQAVWDIRAAVVLDPVAGARVTDRVEQSFARRLHRVAGGQSRERPHLCDPRCSGG